MGLLRVAQKKHRTNQTLVKHSQTKRGVQSAKGIEKDRVLCATPLAKLEYWIDGVME